MLDRNKMRQRGVIVFGRGVNARAWVDIAKRNGFVVLLCDGYAELWGAL